MDEDTTAGILASRVAGLAPNLAKLLFCRSSACLAGFGVFSRVFDGVRGLEGVFVVDKARTFSKESFESPVVSDGTSSVAILKLLSFNDLDVVRSALRPRLGLSDTFLNSGDFDAIGGRALVLVGLLLFDL